MYENNAVAKAYKRQAVERLKAAVTEKAEQDLVDFVAQNEEHSPVDEMHVVIGSVLKTIAGEYTLFHNTAQQNIAELTQEVLAHEVEQGNRKADDAFIMNSLSLLDISSELLFHDINT